MRLRPHLAIEEIAVGSAGKVAHVKKVLALRPDWVERQINRREAFALASEIARTGAASAIEIGVASGFSSAIIFAALAKVSPLPRLLAFDRSRQFYADRSRATGSAFSEIHGQQEGYRLITGVDSGMVASLPQADFCFIDANHRNPWPALDLLSLGRFVRPGGTIALHDVAVKANSSGRPTLGAGVLFESWHGEKRLGEKTPNLGFLTHDPRLVCESVAEALSRQWDTWLSPLAVRRFVAIARSYPGEGGEKLAAILKARAGWAGWIA